MPRFLVRFLLFMSLAAPAGLQNQPSTLQPFTLTWVEGKCKRCQIARQLAEVHFVSKTEAWAVGFLFPYHGQGSGDYVMVHSVDGGRTWQEMVSSRMHAGAPTFAFLDERRGWISSMAPTGECAVRQTEDGGRHWKILSDSCIEISRFFTARQGYGVTSCETEQRCFTRTLDGGRRWKDSVLPLQYVDKTFFVDAQAGWIAGKTRDGKEVVLRTADGGNHWEASMVEAGPDVAEARDLFFADASHGWLISWAFNDGGTRLFKTVDGGKSWIADSDNSFQGKRKWLSAARFIDDKTGFAFNAVDTSTSVPELPPGSDGYMRVDFGTGDKNHLLYTHDGGQHWNSFALPRQVYECQVLQGELLCSALFGESGLWLVRVHPLGR
jgi:photosystem II stability/assembly factor-like uncharacterized protein